MRLYKKTEEERILFHKSVFSNRENLDYDDHGDFSSNVNSALNALCENFITESTHVLLKKGDNNAGIQCIKEIVENELKPEEIGKFLTNLCNNKNNYCRLINNDKDNQEISITNYNRVASVVNKLLNERPEHEVISAPVAPIRPPKPESHKQNSQYPSNPEAANAPVSGELPPAYNFIDPNPQQALSSNNKKNKCNIM